MNRFIESIKKYWLVDLLVIVLVAFIAVGNIYSSYVIEQRALEIEVDEDRYYDEVELLSLEYNFDLSNVGTYTYIASFTYEEQTYEVYLDNDFAYVEMISGDELDLMVLSAVKQHAIDSELLQNTAYIVSYDETTRTVVIEADGFAGTGSISFTVTLTESLDAVSSYTVTSTESYTNDYNSEYTGENVPAVEETMFDQYIAGDLIVDTIAGASEGTGIAMQELITLMDLFIDSLEGGN